MFTEGPTLLLCVRARFPIVPTWRKKIKGLQPPGGAYFLRTA